MRQLENTALVKLTSKRILLGLCVLMFGFFLNPFETANAQTKSAAKAVAKIGGKISKIDVSGNVKIEKDAVTERLKSKVGSAYSPEMIREDIQELFESGFFYNVEVFRNDVGGEIELTYKLTEKPSVTEVVFEGNSEIKTEELQEASGIKAYEILNMNKLRDAVEKLQKMYEDKGFFLAKVEYKIDDIKPNEQVKVSFKVAENDKVKVKKITFIGNNKMQAGQLLSRMQTQEGGYFSFISGSG
ncbi:MAG: POTRA domain-containing protein, partial [Pseudobdellovibrionaceae bacterium]